MKKLYNFRGLTILTQLGILKNELGIYMFYSIRLDFVGYLHYNIVFLQKILTLSLLNVSKFTRTADCHEAIYLHYFLRIG